MTAKALHAAINPSSPIQKVVGYVRVSTDQQAISLEAQEHELKTYAMARQFVWLGCMVDDGTSAAKVRFLERPKVQEMLRQLEPGCQLLVPKLDRY